MHDPVLPISQEKLAELPRRWSPATEGSASSRYARNDIIQAIAARKRLRLRVGKEVDGRSLDGGSATSGVPQGT